MTAANYLKDYYMFPLVQLPKKFKVSLKAMTPAPYAFPLVQLPKKFKVLMGEIRRHEQAWFPLVQLPKKFKDVQ